MLLRILYFIDNNTNFKPIFLTAEGLSVCNLIHKLKINIIHKVDNFLEIINIIFLHRNLVDYLLDCSEMCVENFEIHYLICSIEFKRLVDTVLV